MHKTMTTLGGIPLENARLITGEQATTGAFEEALTRWLPSASQPGDTIFIFYCGHGGQIPARDESEPDGFDEMMSTYDSDSKNPYDTTILDDRLARWLQELPGRQIGLMLETCHGGGVVDGLGMASMMRDEANRCHDVSQLNTAVITACLPDEVSRFFKNRPASLMPQFLSDAMRELPKPVSMQQAFDFYRKRLTATLQNNGAPSYAQAPSLTDHALIPIVLVPADGAAASTAAKP